MLAYQRIRCAYIIFLEDHTTIEMLSPMAEVIQSNLGSTTSL